MRTTARLTTSSKVTEAVTRVHSRGRRTVAFCGNKDHCVARRSATAISGLLAGRRRPAGRRMPSGHTACPITVGCHFSSGGPPFTSPVF